MAPRNNALNIPRFIKTLRMIAPTPEGANAVRQVLEQCEAAGLQFYQALDRAFPELGNDNTEQLEAALAEKKKENDELRSDLQTVSEALRAAQQKMQNDTGNAGASLMGAVTSSPRVFLSSTFAIIALCLCAATTNAPLQPDAWLVVTAISALAAVGYSARLWLELIVQRSGFVVVVFKALPSLTGLYISLGYFCRNMDVRLWRNQDFDLTSALIALLVTYLVAMSKAAEKLVGQLENSTKGMFPMLREWFL